MRVSWSARNGGTWGRDVASREDTLFRVMERTPGSAEWTLDLRGASAEHARISIERMLERRRFGAATTVLICIDPATATSGETLFQPVGRQLLDARARGLVTRFSPRSPAEGGGFHLELPGHPATEVEDE